jgi:transposase
MPAEFGTWDAVYNRFRRWEARSLWRRLWERLQAEDCHVALHLFIDATSVRAPQQAAGAFKKTVAKPHRLWDALGAACLPNSMQDV